ncbi:MAG TPA: tetratricopeptide repeat protein [Candidatus Melainabacteria bacterium]|nr:tetratricopeptide repeat protein [Candidatus Melainabacteria bacterium]
MNSFMSMLFVAFLGGPGLAQGISEYGGLMGMPKNVPSGHQGALTNLYGAGSLDKITGTQSAGAGSALPVVGDSRVIAKNIADKANHYFAEAQKREKAGKLSEAEAWYRGSAQMREQVWGTKDPAVFVIYGKIGALCTKQNKLPEAEAAYRRQIACAVRLYGAGAYEMCPVLAHVAEACVAQNKMPDAINAYRQIYQLKKRKLGDTNPEALGAMLKLAAALKQNGNSAEAETLAKEGAKLAATSQESAALAQSFNEVINPAAVGAAPEAAPEASPQSNPAASTGGSTPSTAPPTGAPQSPESKGEKPHG